MLLTRSAGLLCGGVAGVSPARMGRARPLGGLTGGKVLSPAKQIRFAASKKPYSARYDASWIVVPSKGVNVIA